jgi:hypothetical protein
MWNPDKHRRDVDMSEAAINRRMRTLSELYRFWSCVERSRRQQNAMDRLDSVQDVKMHENLSDCRPDRSGS